MLTYQHIIGGILSQNIYIIFPSVGAKTVQQYDTNKLTINDLFQNNHIIITL